jgi:excisionase family DNA binding protein
VDGPAAPGASGGHCGEFSAPGAGRILGTVGGINTGGLAVTREEKERLAEGGMMSVAQAAEHTGLSQSELYARMAAGRLPFARSGKRRLLPRLAVVKMLADEMVDAGG